MSYIDELRERFLAAEQRFGRIGEASREYRERLKGLMSRIEEEIRCRRDVEQQQAKEIERLSGENEQLRTMMMSLLTAVETGDTDSLGGTLNEMDQKVSTLIGEGQGAAAPVTPAAADLDEYAGNAVEDEAVAAPVFSAGDMMSKSADTAPFSGDDEVGPDAEFSDAGVPAQASLDRTVASEIADFFGAEDQGGDEIVPAYADAVAGWEDFLEDGEPSPEAAMSELTDAEPAPEAPADMTMDATQDEAPEAVGANESLFDEAPETVGANESLFDEVVEDEEPNAGEATDEPEVAEDSGDPDAGSIHDLLGRVKTEIEGDDQDLDADDSGKTAAQ